MTIHPMFKIALLLLFVQLICAAPKTQAQSLVKSAINGKLDFLANEMVNAGVYERVADFGYVPSPERYKRNQPISAHNELTAIIMRFDAMDYDTLSGSYIGRVFIGERYLEMSYNKKYSKIEDYRNDKDGFFMTCKLYYEPRSGEFRLNIYPNYVTNICERAGNPLKGMHYNTVLCSSTEQHWKSLRHLTALGDVHYDSFSQINDSVNVFKFLNPTNPLINIYRQDTSYADLPKRKKNLLRELNLRKQIKCFTVGSTDRSQSGLSASSLRLKFTKYSLSEDFLDGTEYEFRQLPYKGMDSELLSLRGGGNESADTSSIFITRNPLYKSLISSSSPDDSYVPDLYLSPDINVYYVRDSLLEESQVIKGQNSEEKLQSDRLVNIKQRAQIEQKTSSISQAAAYRRPLELLDGRAQIVTSPDESKEHWIYYDQTVQNEAVNNVLTIKSQVFLRDAFPVENANGEWLRGGIKVKFNRGYTAQGEKWEIVDSQPVGPVGQKVSWKKIRKIDK